MPRTLDALGTAPYLDPNDNPESAVARAQVFETGDSPVVRLPDAFRLATSEVHIFRRGDETVLKEVKPDMRRAVDALRELANLIELPDDPPPEAIEPR